MTFLLCHNLLALALIFFSHVVNAEASVEKHQVDYVVAHHSKSNAAEWLPDRDDLLFTKRGIFSQKSDESKVRKKGRQPLCTGVGCVLEGARTEDDINMGMHQKDTPATTSSHGDNARVRRSESMPFQLERTSDVASGSGLGDSEIRHASSSPYPLRDLHYAPKLTRSRRFRMHLPDKVISSSTASSDLHFDIKRRASIKSGSTSERFRKVINFLNTPLKHDNMAQSQRMERSRNVIAENAYPSSAPLSPSFSILHSPTSTHSRPRNGEEEPIGLSMTGKAPIQEVKKESRSRSQRFLDAYHKTARAAVGLLPSQMNQTVKKSLQFDATRRSKVNHPRRNPSPAKRVL